MCGGSDPPPFKPRMVAGFKVASIRRVWRNVPVPRNRCAPVVTPPGTLPRELARDSLLPRPKICARETLVQLPHDM